MQRAFTTTTQFPAGSIFISTPFQLLQSFSVAAPLQMAAGSGGVSGGDMAQLTASVYSAHSGILTFQHSDNASNSGMWETIGCYSIAAVAGTVPGTIGSPQLTSIQGVSVRKLYWRFIYQNTAGVTDTTPFELDINTFNALPPNVDLSGTLLSQSVN